MVTLRIYAPRTIILILCCIHSHDSQPRHDLFQILQEQKDQHLTVTYVRNEILRRDKSIKLDKAVLRRWVNGKFVTLVRRGTLSRHGNERGKVYYLFASQSHQDLRLDTLSEGTPLKEPISRAVPCPMTRLRKS